MSLVAAYIFNTELSEAAEMVKKHVCVCWRWANQAFMRPDHPISTGFVQLLLLEDVVCHSKYGGNCSDLNFVAILDFWFLLAFGVSFCISGYYSFSLKIEALL